MSRTSDGWPSSPEQMADNDEHYVPSAIRRSLDQQMSYLIPDRDHEHNMRPYEFGGNSWKPGDPMWGRQGQHCRHLFDLLPTVFPDFRAGRYWCHYCDVTWSPGVQYESLQESDVQPCWNCDKMTASPRHPAEKIHRVRCAVFADHGYTCEEIAEHFNIELPGPDATFAHWQAWVDRVRKLMYMDRYL